MSPSRTASGNRSEWFHRVLVLIACGFVLALMGWKADVFAQGGKGKKTTPEIEKVTGKVGSIELKGKTANVSVTKEGGETMELTVTAKLKAVVTAMGDTSLLLPKVYVSVTNAFESNNELFGSQIYVFIGKDVPTPNAGIRPNEEKGGTFIVAGTLLNFEKDQLVISAGNAPRRVHFESGVAPTIHVYTSNLDLVKEGTSIEVEGTTRGGKFTPGRVVFTLDKPLVADDLMPKKPEKKTTSKGSKTAKKGTKAAKTDEKDDEQMDEKPTESPTATPETTDQDDPFGFKKKKDPKNKEKDKPAGDNPTDKKSEENKPTDSEA